MVRIVKGSVASTPSALPARLAQGARVIREEWAEVAKGMPRDKYEKLVLFWIDLMAQYFRAGGKECAMAPVGQRCITGQDVVPLCWSCAGGNGAPSWPADAQRKYVILDHQVSKEEFYTYGEPVLVVRASSFGGCRRKFAYGYLEIPMTHPMPEEVENTAELGKAAEAIVIKRLQEEGLEVANVLDGQLSLEADILEQGRIILKVSGHPDGTIIARDAEGDLLLEVKSKNEWLFDQWQAQGALTIVPEHVDQVFVYMQILKLTRTRFEVLARGSGRRFHEIIHFDWAHFKKRVREWVDVVPMIECGDLPNPDYQGEKWPCGYCNWRGVCPATKGLL